MIPDSEEKERALIEALRRGDNAAKSAFYEQFYRYLTAVCARYVVSDEDVRDLIQEVFIKIFAKFDRYEYLGPGSLQAWCHQLTVNEALMFLRRHRRHSFLPIELFDRQDIEDPDRYRIVFNLYVLEDKSHKEIAALLNIRESSSQSNLHRAKKILFKHINDYHKKQPYGR